MIKLLKLIPLILILCPLFAWADDYSIIVSKEFEISQISKQELKALMLGNRTSINGSTAEICMWSGKGSEDFFQAILGVSKAQFNQEWVKKELTGAGRAPASRDSIEEVIDCVASNKGGVGFIKKSSGSPSERKVKVVTLVE